MKNSSHTSPSSQGAPSVRCGMGGISVGDTKALTLRNSHSLLARWEGKGFYTRKAVKFQLVKLREHSDPYALEPHFQKTYWCNSRFSKGMAYKKQKKHTQTMSSDPGFACKTQACVSKALTTARPWMCPIEKVSRSPLPLGKRGWL